jgi:hypothetical protein
MAAVGGQGPRVWNPFQGFRSSRHVHRQEAILAIFTHRVKIARIAGPSKFFTWRSGHHPFQGPRSSERRLSPLLGDPSSQTSPRCAGRRCPADDFRRSHAQGEIQQFGPLAPAPAGERDRVRGVRITLKGLLSGASPRDVARGTDNLRGDAREGVHRAVRPCPRMLAGRAPCSRALGLLVGPPNPVGSAPGCNATPAAPSRRTQPG